MENNETQPLVAPATAPAAESTPSFLRRHAVAVAVVAGVLAVIVVAGGTAWGVSAAVAGTQTAVAPASGGSAGHAGSHTAKAGKRKGAHGARGTLTAVDGDTWTVRSGDGKTVTVKLTSTTAFGTKKSPAERSSFAIGDQVGVLGTRSGDSISATRVVHLAHAAHTSAPSATPTPSA